MKKIISVLAVAVMVLGLSVPVAAVKYVYSIPKGRHCPAGRSRPEHHPQDRAGAHPIIAGESPPPGLAGKATTCRCWCRSAIRKAP